MPTLITAVPVFVSLEEHKKIVGATPASFNDIPPALRHKEEHVSVKLEPALNGFTAEDEAQGTLYVIESVLVFMSATGRGFQVEYPAITLHAVSRAEPGPSIYCQLDENPKIEDDRDDDPDAAAADIKELSIVPPDPSALEPIFEALSICAALHPDPALEDDIGDDNDGAFIGFNGADDEELSEIGRAALAHLETVIDNPFEVPGGEDSEDSEER